MKMYDEGAVCFLRKNKVGYDLKRDIKQGRNKRKKNSKKDLQCYRQPWYIIKVAAETLADDTKEWVRKNELFFENWTTSETALLILTD